MKKQSWMLEQLIEAGHKVTEPRKTVIAHIEKKKGVFSANEIISALPKLDRVSIYRTLELLEELDCIHPVLVQHGEQHYEKHEQKHHHHAVCSGCEKTKCVPCDVKRKRIAGFLDLHHNVVFTGLCVKCAA